MARAERVSKYLGAVHTLSRKDFAQTYPHAVLLESVTSQAARPAAKPRNTMRLNIADLMLQQPAEGSEFHQQLVFPIALTPGGGELTIGRDERSAIHVDADEVSSKHGRLLIEAGSGVVSVEDFDSTNGTFVNGARIPEREPRALADGDVVSFGGVRDFQYCLPTTFYDVLRKRA